MTSRERVIRTLRHEEVDRFPRNLWTLPNVAMFIPDDFQRLVQTFPQDFDGADIKYGVSTYSKGIPNEVGFYADEFGSVWRVCEPGVVGEVCEPVLKDWSRLDSYRMPWEIIEQVDLSRVNAGYASTDKFVFAGSHVRPFERLQFLRGTENLFMDLAYGDAKLLKLIDMVREFECREIEMLVKTDVDGITFMDDWGSQISLLISPSLWREIFKPLYKEYVDIMHKKGKYAFFHSDGFIEAIYPDLVEIGVDAINSQLFCMDIEKLIGLYGDKLTFWGGDRQAAHSPVREGG